ncbi:actin-bundling T4SS effector WalE1 family protein [Wolbachia endosymbiont of Tribolium confusum]|uniref:actin-bundling T4SS effector WalE1 family protein n=1 Tax=Wolbachia endosymbiont of Tribolium confusum TaxID=214474 RepID=UPI001CF585A4|nr:hypothetical protein [Wolbachia endosymbiont of Tribolium confusum]MCA7009842.1 hypothetical protein [Wolbachia endosymbiont of Tribolium confusum]
MSPSEIKSNSRPVEAQQDNFGVSTIMQDSLSADIVHDSKKLKERITDLLKGDTEFSKMKQGDQALVVGTASGLFAAVLPLLAVGATLAIPSAIVGLTLFFAAKVAVKAVQSGYKGLKWSAEKTVEGAKHIGGKIKDGYEYSADSLKRGAHLINEKTKEKASDILTATANKLYRAAGNENYSDRIDDELTPDSSHKKRVQGVKKNLKEIFADKGNNSALIESIRSGISEKIEGKIKAKEEVEFTSSADDFTENLSLITRWKEQKKFIDNLDADGLRKLVTERLVDKDKYFRDSIFSEHHGEIKEVIAKCKEDHILKGSLKMRNNMFKEGDNNKPRSFSLKRSNSEQSNSLSGSSSMNSLSSYSTTSSEAELLNPNEHKEVKAPTSLWSKLSSSLKGGKKPEEVTLTQYERMNADEMQSAEIGNSRFYVAPEKPPRSNSMGSISTDSTATTSSFASYRRSSDSGFNSPSSSPQHGMFTEKNGKLKTQADLRKTGSLDKLVGPSSTVTVDTEVEQQASKINGK